MKVFFNRQWRVVGSNKKFATEQEALDFANKESFSQPEEYEWKSVEETSSPTESTPDLDF